MRFARAAFMGTTAGLAAAGVQALADGHHVARILGSYSLGWFALATTGVFFPHLQMYAPIVWHGPDGDGHMALTFDDGPHPVTTRAVLAALAGTRHRATFFVLGAKARSHPDVIREIQAGGHALALHGDVHNRLHSFRGPWRVRDEILRAKAAVEAAGAIPLSYFRPPLGHTSTTTAWGARLAGVTLVAWSTRTLDGFRSRRPEALVQRVARSV